MDASTTPRRDDQGAAFDPQRAVYRVNEGGQLAPPFRILLRRTLHLTRRQHHTPLRQHLAGLIKADVLRSVHQRSRV
jgi:hypothetical protein